MTLPDQGGEVDPDVGLRMREVFVFVAHRDGVDLVPSARHQTPTGPMIVPLVATEPSQVADMRKVAEAMVADMPDLDRIELVRFTTREHVDWIGEDPDVEPVPPAPEVRCPGCQQRLHGAVADRGGCLACYPKDTDLPAAAG